MSIGKALENIIGTSTMRGPIVRKGAGLIISLLAGGCLRQVEQLMLLVQVLFQASLAQPRSFPDK